VFEQLMGVGRPGRGLSLLDSPYLVEEWGLPSPVVLLSGDGHCWIGLDYRACGSRGEPSVTWFDADAETELPLARTSDRSSKASCPHLKRCDGCWLVRQIPVYCSKGRGETGVRCGSEGRFRCVGGCVSRVTERNFPCSERMDNAVRISPITLSNQPCGLGASVSDTCDVQLDVKVTFTT
jgi:hypothetical protein